MRKDIPHDPVSINLDIHELFPVREPSTKIYMMDYLEMG
ncbi:WSSV192 [White spot syndrome virus]|uniref:WSSV192 n=1 Tax=White spot syndrome virus TaxID=342409 RepID=A0A2I6SBS9_9VIRU|nr:WSSV192 [White spot syndrome virus]